MGYGFEFPVHLRLEFQASVPGDCAPLGGGTRVPLFCGSDRLSKIEGRSFLFLIIYLGAKLKRKPQSFYAQRDLSPSKGADMFLLRRNNDSAGSRASLNLQIRLPRDGRVCQSYLSKFQFRSSPASRLAAGDVVSRHTLTRFVSGKANADRTGHGANKLGVLGVQVRLLGGRS